MTVASFRPRHGPTAPAVPFVVALGSNLGDRMVHLREGVEMLREHTRIDAVSRVVESEAWGPVEQGAFLNLVARGTTTETAVELFRMAQKAEMRAGRVRAERFGPRTLDVDIVFFGDFVIGSPVLTIPHPRWRERPFVAALLQDVAEGMSDPCSGRPIGEIVPPGRLPPELHEIIPAAPTDEWASEAERGTASDSSGTGDSGSPVR